jgi:voltage-gated potassium channel
MQQIDGLIHGRYLALLVSLLVFLIVAPLVQNQPFLEFIIPVLFIIVLLCGLRAVVTNHKYVPFAIALILIGVVARLAGYFVVHLSLFLAGQLAAILFLTLTIIVVLGDIFGGKEVNFDIIAGSVCVYVMIGITWGVIYVAIAVLSPGSFVVNGEVVGQVEVDRILENRFSEFMYFSFVTLTTLGYGDVTPLSPFVRSLAVLEALFGPLYLTVLIARLVGLHITATTK